MMRYRAASRFASLYHPDATLGFLTQDELRDIGPQESADEEKAANLGETLKAAAENRVVEGEVVEETTE